MQQPSTCARTETRPAAARVYLPAGSYPRLDDEHESALLEALIDGRLLGNHDGLGHQRLARARENHGMW
jgi:hypothetical protein